MSSFDDIFKAKLKALSISFVESYIITQRSPCS